MSCDVNFTDTIEIQFRIIIANFHFQSSVEESFQYSHFQTNLSVLCLLHCCGEANRRVEEHDLIFCLTAFPHNGTNIDISNFRSPTLLVYSTHSLHLAFFFL